MDARAGRSPTITVILPFFEDRDSLGGAIESVLAQTFEDWELIAIDDGSPDGSAEVAEAFARRDSRIRVVTRPNGGASAARNSGLAVARGRFCAMIDADDAWRPAKLERQLELAADDTVVFSDALVEDGGRTYPYGTRVDHPEGAYPRGDVFHALLRQNFVVTSTVVAPTLLLRNAGGFDPRLRISHDWHLWLRLSAAGARFDYVPQPLAIYRVRAGSLSHDPEAVRREAVAVLRLLRGGGERSTQAVVDRRLVLARRELEVFLRKRAWVEAAAGETAAARRDLASSLRSNPRSLRALAGVLLALAPPVLRHYARHRPPTSFAGSFVRE